MNTLVWPLVMQIAGALIYAFADQKSKVSEIGRILFFVGTFWLCGTLASHPALRF